MPYGLRGVRAAYFNLTNCRAHVRRSCSPIVLSLFLSYIHLEAQSPPVPPECRKVGRTSKHSPPPLGQETSSNQILLPLGHQNLLTFLIFIATMSFYVPPPAPACSFQYILIEKMFEMNMKYVSNSHDAINSCLRLTAVISPPLQLHFCFFHSRLGNCPSQACFFLSFLLGDLLHFFSLKPKLNVKNFWFCFAHLDIYIQNLLPFHRSSNSNIKLTFF